MWATRVLFWVVLGGIALGLAVMLAIGLAAR